MIEILNSGKEVSQDNQRRAEKSVAVFLQRQDLGFLKIPDRDADWKISQQVGSALKEKYDQLILIGIGGSSLGPKGLTVLLDPTDSDRILFLDNVDGFDLNRTFKKIKNIQRTGILAISKSGGTIETLLGLEHIRQYFSEQKVDFYSRLTVITETTENILGAYAKKHQAGFVPMPKDVGGRFSVLTSVGMVPAAFLGLNLEKFKSGSVAARESSLLVTQFVAQTLESFSRSEWITQFFIYQSRGRLFGDWLQQLWAESLGKAVGRDGQPAQRASTPIVAIGACDQHSVLQQIMEGARDKFIVFWRWKDSENIGPYLESAELDACKVLLNQPIGKMLQVEAQATEQALRKSGRSTLTLVSNKLDEESLAFGWMFFQIVIGALGEAMNLNAFDQPGVELGKRLAKEIIEQNL